MLNSILIGFAGSLIAPVIHNIRKSISGWLIALLPLGLFIYFASFTGPVASGRVFTTSYQWVPGLSIGLSFYLDGLSLLFTLLITGIGALIIVYGGGYLAGHEYQGRFYLLLLSFMASMLGLVLADNLITLFVFWELTSITSYLLIGFEHNKPEARASALQAFLVTGGGGLALLGGMILLGAAGGSYEISALLTEGEAIQGHRYYVPALLLILLGAFTKSAQFPFHFWLPNAMSAPTPVSAYLHSATMVKAGVYLIARLHPALSGTEWWEGVVATVGLLTILVGAFLALNGSDLKRILAYSTISSLGTMVLLLGLNSDEAVKAAIVFLLAHALYKGALFMVAGALDHETGTRDVDRLGGLRSAMPIMAVIAGLAAVSLAGLGPVLSFIGKELLFEAVLATQDRWYIFVPITLISSAVSIAIAAIVTIRPFFGARRDTPHAPHDPPASMWLGPAIMAITGIIFGLMPGLAEKYFAAPAVSAILQEPQTLKLALWHGLNPALLMSGLAILLGTLAYFGWDVWRRTMNRFEAWLQWGPEYLYSWFIISMNWVASFQTKIIQNGYLRFYLLAIIIVTVGMSGTMLVLQQGFHWPERLTSVNFYEAALAVMIVVAAIVAARSVSRLGAIASLGVVGYSIALIYLLFGAPDLAMTQFLIESITVVLFVFAFYRLPQFNPLGPKGPRLLHAVVAIFTGVLMTALVLSAVEVNLFPSISEYFSESAVSLAHGRNIVNVILVDFRGLDTLGEITVLAVAAAGVYAILRYRKKEEL